MRPVQAGSAWPRCCCCCCWSSRQPAADTRTSRLQRQRTWRQPALAACITSWAPHVLQLPPWLGLGSQLQAGRRVGSLGWVRRCRMGQLVQGRTVGTVGRRGRPGAPHLALLDALGVGVHHPDAAAGVLGRTPATGEAHRAGRCLAAGRRRSATTAALIAARGAAGKLAQVLCAARKARGPRRRGRGEGNPRAGLRHLFKPTHHECRSRRPQIEHSAAM